MPAPRCHHGGRRLIRAATVITFAVAGEPVRELVFHPRCAGKWWVSPAAAWWRATAQAMLDRGASLEIDG